MGHELIRYLTCQRRLISEPIERCFDSIAEQVEHASQEVSRSLRFPLTPLEKRAQRNDAPLKRKNGHFFLPSKSSQFGPQSARNYVGANRTRFLSSLGIRYGGLDPVTMSVSH